MVKVVRKWFCLWNGTLRSLFQSRSELMIENLALRQQLATFHEQRPKPRLTTLDRTFWVLQRLMVKDWSKHLLLVKPETVVGWHRQGFRLFWKHKSRKVNPGRPRVSPEIRELIRKMATENNWGAPRIHGELLKLGFEVDERTVSRYLPRRKPLPEEMDRWKAFLRNHVNHIAAMDFLTVPSATFVNLYVLVIMCHGRRRILHTNVTTNPTEEWVVQQLRNTFDGSDNPRYMIIDNDSIFSKRVRQWLDDSGIQVKRTAVRSPWQNGKAERLLGSICRELLDHVIVLGERNLRMLLRKYTEYYHADRCHLALGKDPPYTREVIPRPSKNARVISLPRVGGIHHRYEWRDAA